MLGMDSVDDFINIILVGNIQHHTLRPTAILLNHGFGFVQHGKPSAGNDDFRSFISQIDADSSADACSPACYDCNLILQLFCHGYRSFL
ncbi:hypothetical protein D3C75_581550 [compost metagenome]